MSIKSFALLAATVAIAGAAPAYAEPSHSGAAATSANSVQAASAPKFCIKADYTGTRVPKTVCLTKEQWARRSVDIDQLDKSR